MCLVPLFLAQYVRLRPGVVVGQFHTNIASIFALEVQLMPQVVLAAARHNDIVEVDPGFTDEVCFLVVVEDGALQFVVVGGVVDVESEFLIPVFRSQSKGP